MSTGYKNSEEIELLIEGCLEKQPKAQKELYSRYAKKMTAVCLRYLGDYDTALDLMHDGFIRVFNKIHLYTYEGPFDAWIRRVFVNVCLEYLRKKDPLSDCLSIEDAYEISTNEPSVLEDIGYMQLISIINELPVGFRTVFNLYAIEGYSHAEIAQVLNINESSSRSQFSRAKVILQNKIKKHNRIKCEKL